EEALACALEVALQGGLRVVCRRHAGHPPPGHRHGGHRHGGHRPATAGTRAGPSANTARVSHTTPQPPPVSPAASARVAVRVARPVAAALVSASAVLLFAVHVRPLAYVPLVAGVALGLAVDRRL